MTTYARDTTGRATTFGSLPQAIEWAVAASQQPQPQRIEVGWVGLGQACTINNGVALVDSKAEYVATTARNAGATVQMQ
jgi:hypothetical protein